MKHQQSRVLLGKARRIAAMVLVFSLLIGQAGLMPGVYAIEETVSQNYAEQKESDLDATEQAEEIKTPASDSGDTNDNEAVSGESGNSSDSEVKPPEEAECACVRLCTEDEVNEDCPVCGEGFENCAYEVAQPENQCTCAALCTEDSIDENCPVCKEGFENCTYEESQPEKQCTCTALCAEGSIDENCPVCKEGFENCAYEQPEMQCTCTAPCAEGSIDENCPVCKEGFENCAYEQPEKQCICTTLCAEGSIDENCPVCAEGIKDCAFYQNAQSAISNVLEMAKALAGWYDKLAADDPGCVNEDGVLLEETQREKFMADYDAMMAAADALAAELAETNPDFDVFGALAADETFVRLTELYRLTGGYQTELEAAPTVQGTMVYANCTPIVVTGDASTTYIYQADISGSIIGSPLTNSDLSSGNKRVDVAGGYDSGTRTGDARIWITGGNKLCYVDGGNHSVGSTLPGTVYIRMTGGNISAAAIYGGGEGNLNGDVNINISGGHVSTAMGGGWGTVYNTNVVVEGSATAGSIYGGGTTTQGNVANSTSVAIQGNAKVTNVTGGGNRWASYSGSVGVLASTRIRGNATVTNVFGGTYNVEDKDTTKKAIVYIFDSAKVTGSVKGHAKESEIRIYGSPTIGTAGAENGIDLNTFTKSYVQITGQLTSAAKINLIPPTGAKQGTVLAQADYDSHFTVANFTLTGGMPCYKDGVNLRYGTEPPTVDGSSIYANGTPLVIEKDGSGSTVYIDTNGDGKKDDGEKSLQEAGILNAPVNGADLSGYSIYGGTSGHTMAGGTKITLNGGRVKNITSGHISSYTAVIPSAYIALNGGMADGVTFSANITSSTAALSGNPRIPTGLNLTNVTGKKVTLTGPLTGADSGILLSGTAVSQGTVVGTGSGYTPVPADADKFRLSGGQPLQVSGSNIVIATLPAQQANSACWIVGRSAGQNGLYTDENGTTKLQTGYDGSWSYDEATKTLTLTNFAFRTSSIKGFVMLNRPDAGTVSGGEYTIVLQGKNSITATFNGDNSSGFGMLIYGDVRAKSTLRFTGDGSLTVTAPNIGNSWGSYGLSSNAANAVNIEMNGTGRLVLNAGTGSYSWGTNAALTVNSGTVILRGGSANNTSLASAGDIAVNGGTLYASGYTSAMATDSTLKLPLYYSYWKSGTAEAVSGSLVSGITTPLIISNLDRTVYITDYEPPENRNPFTKLEIRAETAEGDVVVDLLDSASVSGDWALTPGADYYLYAEMERWPGVDHVQLRYGNNDNTYNGVTFANPPGGGYTAGDISHDYFDKLEKYTNFAEPPYGSGTAKLTLRDGEMIYHIKDGQTAANFSVGLVVNDAVYNDSGQIADAIGVSAGSYAGGTFTPSAEREISLKVGEKNKIKSYMIQATATAELGGTGNSVYSYALTNNDTTEQAAALFDTFTVDVTYPKGAVLDYGFGTTFVKTHSTYGTLSLAEPGTESVVNGKTMVTKTLTATRGYKTLSATMSVYFRLDFPANAGFTAGKYTLTLSNQKFTIGGTELTPITAGLNQVTTYTVTEAGNDATTMTAMNRPDVYNHTIDMNQGDYLVPLGSAYIKNGSAGSHSPYVKTFEAAFNTTGTAAEVTVITVPLGDKADPVITWEGKDSGGNAKSGTLTQEQILAAAYEKPGSLENSKFLMLHAKDLGLASFTKVTAEIGRLRPAYVTTTWTSGWSFTYNMSGAFGHFTTGENGLEVVNTYKLYNTDPALRDKTNGDLTVTTSATSTNEQRAGFNSGTIKLGSAAINTDSSVAAGETAKITGTIYPYTVARAAYDKSVSPTEYATSMRIKNPVFYLTLPFGLTPDQDGISFSQINYNDRGAKVSTSPSLAYTLTQTGSTGDITTYKITLPEGTVIGYYDGDGNYSMLSYSLAFATEKSLATQRYRLNDLVTLTTEDGVKAVSYTGVNNATLVYVKEDAYSFNGGRDVAGIAKDKDDTPVGFGVQQQAEIVVESAINVTTVNGAPVTHEWASYSPSNPNSVSMMGNTCAGQVRLSIKNTSDNTGKNFKLLLPIPQQGMDLGDIFMRSPQGFTMSMQNILASGSASQFSVSYAKITGSHDSVPAFFEGSGNYTAVTDAGDANALLITAASLSKGNYTLFLDYTVAGGTAGTSNIWQPVYAYTVETEDRQKTGGAVAGAIAGSAVSGTVFADADGNGVMDGSEAGVAGIQVTAMDAQGRTASATTDTSGHYEFTAVRESALTLTFTVDSGKNLRFNVQPSSSGSGTVSTVIPAANGLSASRSIYASGDMTVNAAMKGFVTLSYDKNGATTGVLPVSGEYSSGDSATVSVKPDNLKKTGHRFTGWNTQADGGGTAYQPGAVISPITADTTLYAQWAVTDYLITFNYRGATGGNTETGRRVQHNTRYGGGTSGAYTNPLPTPTKAGYTFKGWTRTVTGTSANVKDATKFTLGADTILYALWTPKSDYVVKYDTDGGSAIADKTGVAWDGTVLPASSPAKTGFVFDGWRHLGSGTEINALTCFNDLAADDTTAEATLTAKWRAKTGFTVKYDANGGSGSLFDKTGVSWTDQNLLPAQNPTRNNYAFDGWTLGDTTQTVTAADSYGALAVQETVTVITLKAAWKEITGNMVKYDAAGGTPVKDKNGVKAGDPVLPEESTTRKGYTFDGWYHGATMVTDTTTYSELAASGEKSITLTAHWTQKSYTITYTTENGTTIPDANKTWTENGLLPSTALSKDGYTFGGWYYNGAAVMASDTVSTLLPADDADTLTLTAKWLEKTYTVLYDTQGGNYIAPRTNVRYTAKNLLPDVSAVKTGYTLEKWTAQVGADTKTVTDATTLSELVASGDLAGVITLTANWTAKSGYTVAYDTGGGSTVADKTGVGWEDTGLLPGTLPTRGGYELTGWLCGRIAVTDATAFSQIASSDADGTAVTLVAQWSEQADYIVRYVTDSETNIEDKTGVRWNQRLLLPSVNPDREGYAFLGWAVNAGEAGERLVHNTDAYASLVTDAGQSILVLTAKWEEKAHYVVKFDTDGGGSIPDKNSVFYESMTNLLPTEVPTKYGYAFDGWTYTKDSGAVIAVTNSMTYASLAERDTVESITLTAVWTPKTYTVRYDTDGADDIPQLENVLWMDAPILPESDPVKTGYRVEGWYYEGRKVETSNSLGDVVLEDSEALTEITLTANWEEQRYTVLYDEDGGTAVADRTVPYTAENLLPDSATYRKGYAFDGWYYGDTLVKAPETTVTGTEDNETTVTTPGTSVNDLLGDSANSMSELTLKARWTAISGYQVHYDTAGGSFAASRTGLSWTDTNLMPVTAPTKSGHTLSGWKHGGTTVTADTAFGQLSESDAPGSAITLTAVWTEKSAYTVKYDKNGATSADIADKTGVAWTQAGLLPTPNPVRTGYAFGGWKLDGWQVASETTYATLAGMDDTAASVTLKAIWNPIRDNTVKYDTDGGSVLADKTGVVWDEAGLLPENPTKSGYTFAGWKHGATDVTASTKYSELAGTVATKEITLKAQWTEKTYTVTYDTVGGTDIAEKTGVKWADNGLPPATNPTKEHFDFAGWKCGDLEVAAGTAFESLAADDTVTGVTLTAQWTPKDYTVKYDTVGGSPIAEKTVQWDNGSLLPDAVPMKQGFVFSHWEYDGAKVLETTTYGELAGPGAPVPQSITLKAVYTPAQQDTGGVEGSIITDTDGNPIAGVYVSVRSGGTDGRLVAGPVITGADGKFSFYGLPYGIDTLVAKRTLPAGQEQTITKTIEISNVVANGDMVMPSGWRNTIVEVKPGTPPAAAEGLDDLFQTSNLVGNPENGVTEADNQAVQDGGSMEIRLTIERKETDDAGIEGDMTEIKNQVGTNYTLLPFDLSLIKTVTDQASNTTATNLKKLPVLIDIVIPISEISGKEIKVLRVHEGEVHALPHTDGALTETFTYRDGNLHLNARMFSTYVIAYANKSGGGNNPGGGSNPGGGGSSPDGGGSDGGSGNGSGSITHSHIIAASAGEGGVIVPIGRVPVRHGESAVFAMKPLEGYAVDDVLVDGKSVGVMSQYLFWNVRRDHTIEAIFKKTMADSGSGSAPSDGENASGPAGSDPIESGTTGTGQTPPESANETIGGRENPERAQKPDEAFQKQKEEMIADLERRFKEASASLPKDLTEEAREKALRNLESACQKASETLTNTSNPQEAVDAYNEAVRNYERIVTESGGEIPADAPETEGPPFILLSALLALAAVLGAVLAWRRGKEDDADEDRQHKRRSSPVLAAGAAVLASLIFLLTTGWQGIVLANWWTIAVAVPTAASLWLALRHGDNGEKDAQEISEK